MEHPRIFCYKKEAKKLLKTEMFNFLERDERFKYKMVCLRLYLDYLGCPRLSLALALSKVYICDFLMDALYRVSSCCLSKDGHVKTQARQHQCSECHRTTHRHQKLQTPKIQKRHVSLNIVHCHCGKCSLYGVINNTCPNGHTPASLLSVCASVYPAFSADSGVLPADRGLGALLQPKMAYLCEGHGAQCEHDLVLQSVDKQVKTCLALQAIDKHLPPDKASLRTEPTGVIDIHLIFSVKKCLSCNDQIVHTEACILPTCRANSHSLTTALRAYSRTSRACRPLFDVIYLLETLLLIHQCVHRLSVALVALLIILSGDVETNPGPVGVPHDAVDCDPTIKYQKYIYDFQAMDGGIFIEMVQETTSSNNNKMKKCLKKLNYDKQESDMYTGCTFQKIKVHDSNPSECEQRNEESYHLLLFGFRRLFSSCVSSVHDSDSNDSAAATSNTKYNKQFGAKMRQSCNLYGWNLLSTKVNPINSTMVNQVLLILAGDVEENPGPFGRSKSKTNRSDGKGKGVSKSKQGKESLSVKVPKESDVRIKQSAKHSPSSEMRPSMDLDTPYSFKNVQPLPPPSIMDLAIIPMAVEKWYEIGVALGISEQLLNHIKKSKSVANKKKREMFEEFLNLSNPTWEKVIHALEECDEHDTAHKTCENFDLPLTLLQHGIKTRKVVTAPVNTIENPVQSDNTFKSLSGRIVADTGLVLAKDDQSTHRHSSSGSSPTTEKCSITKSFVDDGDQNEQYPCLSETVVTSKTKSSALQSGVASDDSRRMGNQHQSSIDHGTSPKSDSLEYLSFSDNESGLSVIPQIPTTSGKTHVTGTVPPGEKELDVGSSESTSAVSSLSKSSMSLGVQKSTNPQLGFAGSGEHLISESGLITTSSQLHAEDTKTHDQEDLSSKGGAPTSSSVMSKEISEFYQAVVKNNLEKGNTLLSQGLDPDYILEDTTQQVGLHITSRLGHKEFVKILLKHKASVNLKDSNGCSPLYLAASTGNYEITKLIVALPDCDIHTVNKDGSPLLFEPSSKGFNMICELLLENGADPLAENRTGMSPLYIASRNGHKEVVKVLLKYGADCTRVCMETSKTSLHEAIDSDHVEIVKILMKAVSEANKKNEKLFTSKTAEGIRQLVKERAFVDIRKADGRTPLIVHASQGNKEVVDELIEHKANVDLQDNEGWSALMVASNNGHAVVVQHLIFAGAIPDLKSKEGLSALMYAVIKDYVKIVNELILAKADPSLKSSDGYTAFELAKDKAEILDVLKRHRTTTFGSNPLYNLLGTYLKKKEESTAENKATRKAISSLVSGPPAPVDETSTAKEEVEKCYKRIADLETRIHDLTVTQRVNCDTPEDSDLSYLERKRLEDEFRKLKELKRKAEQYAIEAKQTAQRLSADNFKLREDLSRERHHNELTRKNIIREIEQKVDRVATSEERMTARREVFEQEVQQKAYQLLRKMPHGERRILSKRELSPGDLKEFMFKHSVTVNLLELAIAGLPCSGKNELLDHILELKTSTTEPRLSVAGVDVYEAIMHYNEDDESFAWLESTKEEAHIHTLATALAQVLARTQRSPSFVEGVSGATSLFDDPNVEEYFHGTYSLLKKVVSRLENDGSMEKLTTTRLTLLNLVNIGVNKTAFEILGILARRCKNLVLLNVLNLERETPEQFNKPPDLSNHNLYGGRYKHRKDDENLLSLHSALHYYMQVVLAAGGSEQNKNVILVGTHKDKLSQGVFKSRKKYIEQTTLAYAEEVGIAKSICRDMECINAKDALDCNRLRKRIVELIHHKKKFEFKIPISHIFFRCYLHNLKKLFISRQQLVKEAMKCGITENKDIDTFLLMFNNCGSIFYSGDGEFPFLNEYVILDPFRFVEGLDKLYYVDTLLQDKPQLYEAVDKSQYGFFSDHLASELWPGEGDGGMSEAQFFVRVLEDLKVIARIHPNLVKSIETITPTCQNCYFMPSLRPKFDTSTPKFDSNSLFIEYNVAMIPFHLQSNILLYLQSQLGQTITFDPKPFYNIVCFKWHAPQQPCEANISVQFQTEHIEVSIKFLGQAPRLSHVTHLFSTLKTFCILMLQQISSHIKGFEYKLAIVCPNNSESHVPPANVHYLTFHPLAIKQKSFYCEKCEKSITSEQLPWTRLLWTQVAFNGTTKSAYQDDDFDSEEIAVISQYLASHHTPETLQNIVVSLGYKRSELLEKRMFTSLESLLHQLIFEWHCRNPSNSIKLFAQILYSCGCYREAIRLDNALLNSSNTTLATHNPSRDLSRRELSCIVSHAAKESIWKHVLQFLTIRPESVKSVGGGAKTISEQRFDSVKSFAISSEFQDRGVMVVDTAGSGNARKKIVQQLLRSDYTSLATNLEIGMIDARVPSNFLCNF